MKSNKLIIVSTIILLLSYIKLTAEIILSDFDGLQKNIESIEKLIDRSSQLNALDTNIVYANHAYQMSEEIGYDEGKIKSLHILGLNYYLAGDYEKSIYFLLKEAECIQSNEDNKLKKYLGENFRMLGEVNRASREFELA